MTTVFRTVGPIVLKPYTTAERDALNAEEGMFLRNSTTNQFEAYIEGAWRGLLLLSAAGEISTTQHGTFAADDLHLEYARIGAPEEITAVWILGDGGSLRCTPGNPPVGEMVGQIKDVTGAPTHTASLGVHCYVSPDDEEYINSGGASWTKQAKSSDLHAQAHGISAHTEHANWKTFYSDGSGDEKELALGTDGQILKATGASAAPAFEDDEAGIEFIISGGGSVISTGIADGCLEVPFACTIKSVRLLADQAGSIKIDIWKDTYANYPPTNADTITGGNEPEIAAAIKDEDETLTDWTTALAKGDILYYNVDSVATIEWCLVTLMVNKT